MKQDIEYNGKAAAQMKLLISEEISIPSPKAKYTEYEITGRDGKLLIDEGSYDDITINIPFNYAEKDDWGTVFRSAKAWLFRRGNRILKLSRLSGYFYKVKKVEISADERSIQRAGKFQASFLCEPYAYLEDGLNERETGTLYNPYERSHPTYQITGEGVCSMTVNGSTVTANVGQNLTINTDLMLAYREDGTLQNTSISGDYEDLYLRPGDNTISITDGFELKVIPNWRCL